MRHEALSALTRLSLRERCLAALRSAVTTGGIAPGAHLREVDLAAGFDVSRATVREALRHMQQEGLAVADHRGRLRVRQLDRVEIREIYRVRAALEALAAETLASLADRRQLVAELRAAVEVLGATAGDLPAQVEADLAFHLKLCALSGNRTLVRSWQHLEGPVRITILHAGLERALHNMAAVRHEVIVEAISAGDVARVRNVVFDHMTQAAERLVQATTADT